LRNEEVDQGRADRRHPQPDGERTAQPVERDHGAQLVESTALLGIEIGDLEIGQSGHGVLFPRRTEFRLARHDAIKP
jgi:hypothetical protein